MTILISLVADPEGHPDEIRTVGPSAQAMTVMESLEPGWYSLTKEPGPHYDVKFDYPRPPGLFWITADSDNLWTCGICGALVWMDGEGVDLHRKWHKGGSVVDMLSDKKTDSDGEPSTDHQDIVWQPPDHSHSHPMPTASEYPPGSVARCETCQQVFVRETPNYLTFEGRAWWRRLRWFGVSWRRVLGRVPNPSTT